MSNLMKVAVCAMLVSLCAAAADEVGAVPAAPVPAAESGVVGSLDDARKLGGEVLDAFAAGEGARVLSLLPTQLKAASSSEQINAACLIVTSRAGTIGKAEYLTSLRGVAGPVLLWKVEFTRKNPSGGDVVVDGLFTASFLHNDNKYTLIGFHFL